MNFSNLWDVVGFFFWTFVFISYLMALFSVLSDLFRDHTLAGGYKALWIIALVFVPFITVLAYLIFRGKSMGDRQLAANQQAQKQASAYIKELGGAGAADEISKAKALLDSKAITKAEFDTIKARALA